ncbi:MAG: ABC transporter substrate-binding protein [Dietzia sp.]
MNMNRRRPRVFRDKAVALVALLGMVVATACSAPEQPSEDSQDQTITVVDDAGRIVEFDGPIESAVVANRYNSELIRAMGDIDKVISVDANTAQDRVYWSQFDPDEVIGKGQSELNVEKIIELDPEVLILPRNGKVDEYAAALEPVGIKVLTVTGWDNGDFASQLEILGSAFDNEAGAARVTEFFESTKADITDRVGGVEPAKTVYWEYGDPYTTAIPETSNDGWHQMIVAAGGVNMFGDPTLEGDTVDPEQILTTDPDLILKTTSGGALKNTGVYTPPADGEFASIGQEMIARPGWSELTAVREGNVHMITGFAGGGLGKIVGAVYLAKWLYPEQMQDVDPDDVFAEWLELQGMELPEGHVYTVPATR